MTSGIDGVYPPGLPVATIVDIPQLMDTNYASIRCKPQSHVNATRHVLVMPVQEIPNKALSASAGSGAGETEAVTP